jgi:hypothetical protein
MLNRVNVVLPGDLLETVCTKSRAKNGQATPCLAVSSSQSFRTAFSLPHAKPVVVP